MTDPAAYGAPAGGNDAVRRGNLAFVLRNVHVAPSTRSRLTRLSGLNRSTIGALVAELAARGLVVEDDPSADGQIGRPSPVVRAADGPLAVAVNPEVDAVTVATVRLGGRVLHKERVPFDRPPDPAATVAAAAAATKRLVRAAGPDHRVVGVGVAVPGIVQPGDGVVRLAPHLGWHDAPLGAAFAEALGRPVAVGNDSNLGTRAEWVFGAGRGASDLVYLHGGASGIGGGIVSGGALLHGASGRAGEFGHTAVRRRGTADSAGAPGSLETESSRAGLLAAVGLTDAEADRLDEALAADRSVRVREEVHRQVDAVAVVVANAITALNPAVVVLGGYLGSLAATARARLQQAVEDRTLPALHESVAIRPAELGADLLLIGAAELAFADLFADPLLTA